MSTSDKKIGVVGLTLFDLRRRGKVGKLSMVGTSGSKYSAIRTSSNLVVVLQPAQPGFARRTSPKEHLLGLQQPRRLLRFFSLRYHIS